MRGLEMNRHGSIAFSLLIILVLAVLGAGILLRSVNENKIAKRNSDSTQAFWLADAGMQRVKYEKKTNNCAGMKRQDTSAACTDCTCAGVTKVYQATISGVGDIDATLNSANTTIQSTGSVPDRSSTSKLTRQLQGTFGGSQMFGYAAFSRGTFFMSNSATVDSYNSNNNGTDYDPAHPNSNGDIGTNGTTAGIINMSNSATINGDASTGPHGTISLNNSASVTGTQTSANLIGLPWVSVPSALSSLSSGGAINRDDQTGDLTLSAGNYKYDSVTLSNSSKLVINGDVTLYVHGNIATSNSTQVQIVNGGSLTLYTDGTITMSNSSTFNNISKNPSKVMIYSTYSSGTGLSLGNSTTLYAGVYMPNADYTGSNSAEIMGALVAKVVSLSNSDKIHYDEAMASLINPFASSSLSVVNWQEL